MRETESGRYRYLDGLDGLSDIASSSMKEKK